MRLLLIYILLFGFAVIDGSAQTPIDSKASKKTAYLLQNLKRISQNGFMFGHEDDQAYGVGWQAEEGRSDVKEITGKYPAVHGWDVGRKLDHPFNIDSVGWDNMKRWITDAYKRGGVNTVSFHMDNLTSSSDSWDKTPSVKDILPGGSKHDEFNSQLDMLADFFMDLKKVPIVFRPWHEHNGDWFWWGKGNCTEDDYKTFFKYTVEYLRDKKEVHNLLYAFSPDRSRLDLTQNPKANYFYGYPGDEYVDIIGLDDYWDVGDVREGNTLEIQKANLVKSLQMITEIASEKNKVAALTETGYEGVKRDNWYTDTILNPIKENAESIQISWVLVWRNYDKKHHYAPYMGHPAVADFKEFEADDMTYFESGLNKRMYKKMKAKK